MSDTTDDLRDQLTDAFADADYPVSSQMDLGPSLPDGPMTTFEAGDVEFTAMELASKLGDEQEFPYDSVDALVDDIIAGLRETDLL